MHQRPFFVLDSFWTLFRDKNEKENRLFFDSEFLEFSLESDEIDETDKSCIHCPVPSCHVLSFAAPNEAWFKPIIELEGIWQKPKCLKAGPENFAGNFFSAQKQKNGIWTDKKFSFLIQT